MMNDDHPPRDSSKTCGLFLGSLRFGRMSAAENHPLPLPTSSEAPSAPRAAKPRVPRPAVDPAPPVQAPRPTEIATPKNGAVKADQAPTAVNSAGVRPVFPQAPQESDQNVLGQSRFPDHYKILQCHLSSLPAGQASG